MSTSEAHMLETYIKAITKVGGNPLIFVRNINTMTVWEMFEALANNGVRFVATDEREAEDNSRRLK